MAYPNYMYIITLLLFTCLSKSFSQATLTNVICLKSKMVCTFKIVKIKSYTYICTSKIVKNYRMYMQNA